MRMRTKKLLALCMTLAMLTVMVVPGASAAEKTKAFTLPCGDGITLSNYVDVRTEDLLIDGLLETVTYYLVDDNTKITFNMTSGNAVEGTTMMSVFLGGNEYESYAGYYLGASWGWPETSSPYDMFNFSDSPLSGVSITDFDSEIIWAEDGYSYGYTDNASFYVMDAKQYVPAAIHAAPTASNVLVNGAQTAFDAYTINDNNYFKLRDLAFVLNGSGKQFQVTWDGANNAIQMLSGTAYTPVGGEMAGKGAEGKTATTSSAKIILNGKEISLTAYTIDGNNYFKLRDVGKAFNFGVNWDGTKNTISIDTASSYVE